MNVIINPAGCGKDSPILELTMNLVNTKQIKPNTITVVEEDFGFSKVSLWGRLPFGQR